MTIITYLSADVAGLCSKVLKHTSGNTLALAKETKKQVLGADIVVTCSNQSVRHTDRDENHPASSFYPRY